MNVWTIRFVIGLAIALNTSLTAKQTNDRVPQLETTDQQDRLVNDMIVSLRQNAQSPTEFIIDKFEKHELILLGEVHHVQENCELVASLIAPLNAVGVKRLCSEFTPSRFNDQLEEIVTGKVYDESAVMDLFRNGPWPNWGHREYMDIIKNVWIVNQDLKPGELPFLIVGIDSDWSQIEQFSMDRAARFALNVNREKHMERIIKETSIQQDQKALVHIGFAHTVPHGIRLGNEVRKDCGDRLFQIMLHHALRTRTGLSEITTILERSFAEGKLSSKGFDVGGTPIAHLEDPSIPYVSHFNRLAEGYIFLRPSHELTKTTWVDGFINEANFKDALFLAEKFGWTEDHVPSTPEELDALHSKIFSTR